MKCVILLALLGALVAAALADDAVLVLTEKNFQKTINGNEYVLVEFYAPWCGHCKQLEPEYAEAAAQLQADGIVLAKVDATVETDLAEEHQIQGYPTIKFFKLGEVSDYNGGRKAADIVRWMKRKSGPTTRPLAKAADVEAFIADQEHPVVGFFAKRTVAYKQFQKAADELEGFTFGEVMDADVAAAMGVAETPAVVLFAEGGERHTYVGGAEREFDRQELARFVKQKSLPLVGEIGPSNFAAYYEAGLPLFLAFLDKEDAEQLSSVRAAMETAAAEHRGRYSFAYCDGVQFAEQAKRFGASGSTPDMAHLNFAKNINLGFEHEQPFSAVSMADWVAKVHSGEVQWKPKSEPVPESQDGPVRVLVGSNVEEAVNDAAKDVFVMFYAPWCGHCKALAPAWTELAANYAAVDSMVVAKIDADANDAAHVAKIEGFPTLVLYRAGDNKPIKFSGDRSVEAMTEFLKANAAGAGKQEL